MNPLLGRLIERVRHGPNRGARRHPVAGDATAPFVRSAISRMVFESLEQRLLLSADGVSAFDASAASAQSLGVGGFNESVEPASEQVVYIDLDGHRSATYDGPIRVEFDVPVFVPPEALAGERPEIIVSMLEALDASTAGWNVRFTVDRPEGDAPWSTVYLGGDGAAFAEYGTYWGLAEKVDAGNADRSDEAFVFSDAIPFDTTDARSYGRELARYVAHEAGHLLGLAHFYDGHEHDDAGRPLDAVAFKPFTHVEIAKDVRADVMEDGQLTISGHEYEVHPRVRAALELYPSYYYAGAVGPDGFPDVVMGQQVIHPIDTGTWYQHALDMAWAAQSSPDYTEAEKLQALAWSYGFLTHGAGDVWAHTLINEFTQGVFPGLGDIVEEDVALANAIRHFLAEAYVGDATPNFEGLDGRTTLPDGDVSDDESPGIDYDAPIRFIYETLLQPFAGDPSVTAEDPDGSRGKVVDQFLLLRSQLVTALSLSPVAEVSDYLSDWIAAIDDGIRNWGEVGRAITRGAFDPQLRRDMQNIEGAPHGTDVDGARGEVEDSIGMVDAVLFALDDPNGDRDLSDSYITNHLLPMLGVPVEIAQIQGQLGTFANFLDDEIVGPMRLAVNPLFALADEIAEIPKQFVKDMIRDRFGFDVDTVDLLLGMSNKMDLASITIGDRVIPVFLPDDHEKLDAYLGIVGIENSELIPAEVNEIPGATFYEGARGFLGHNIEFDKEKFAAYANSVVLGKLLLLMEEPIDGATTGAGALSAVMSDHLVGGYDFSLLNLNGAHGGNIITATLPKPGVTVDLRNEAGEVVATVPADTRPWMLSIDTDHGWREESRTLVSQRYRVHEPGTGDARAIWTFAAVAGGEYALQASWVANFAFPPATDARYDVFVDGALVDFAIIDQRTLPDDVQEGGIGFGELLRFSAAAGSTVRVELSGGTTRPLIAGPMRLERVADGSAVTVERDRAAPATDGYDETGTWVDLAYTAGSGNFPLWESDLLRPVFRTLFTDWQNGSENFPDLGDATSDDPNDTPGIVASPIGALLAPFEPSQIVVPAGGDLVVAGVQVIDLAGDVTLDSIVGNGDATADVLTLNVSGRLTLTGGAGGGGLRGLTINAAAIDIAPGVVVHTRQIAGGDPFAAVSVGDSGHIVFNATTITIGNDAMLLAGASAGFLAGDVLLSASANFDSDWFLGISGFRLTGSEAGIDIGRGAVLTGRDVRATALASTAKTVELTQDMLPGVDTELEHEVEEQDLVAVSQVAAAVLAGASAHVVLGEGARIDGTRDVVLEAEALADARIATSSRHFGLTYASTSPEARVIVDNGAQIVAGNLFGAEARASNTLDVATIVPQAGDALNVSIAYAKTDAVAETDIRSGARVTALDAVVLAENLNTLSNVALAAGYPDSGSAGLGGTVVVGNYRSNATATVSATLQIGNDLTVDARSRNVESDSRAFASVAGPAGEAAILDRIGEFLAAVDLEGEVGGEVLDPAAEGASLALAGAVVIAQSENRAAALIDDGAWVSAAGDITVMSLAEEHLQASAVSSAGDTSTASLGGAVAWANVLNMSAAAIGANAVVDAQHALTVRADAVVPPAADVSFDPVIDLTDADLTTGTARIGEQYADGEALGNRLQQALDPGRPWLDAVLAGPTPAATIYVHTAGTTAPGGAVGIAGGVAWLDVHNEANATVAGGAQVNQRFAGAADQDVTVQAFAELAPIALVGLEADFLLPDGNEGVLGIGGNLNRLDLTNRAAAHVDDRAQVDAARDLVVRSEAGSDVIAFGAGGTDAASLALSGVVNLLQLDSVSLAYIEDRAFVGTGRDLRVHANAGTEVVNLAGGLTIGPDAGIGASGAINAVDEAVYAFIGDSVFTLHGPDVELPSLDDALATLGLEAPADDRPPHHAFGDPFAGVGEIGTGGVTGSVAASGAIDVRSAATREVWAFTVSGVGSGGTPEGVGPDGSHRGMGFGFGLSGDVAYNDVTADTEAFVRDVPVVTATGDFTISASDFQELEAAAGAVGYGNHVGMAGALAHNGSARTVRAFTQDTALEAGNLTLRAAGTDTFVAFADGGAGANATAALAGSVTLNRTFNTAEALVGDRTHVDATGAVDVRSEHSGHYAANAGGDATGTNTVLAVGAAFDISALDNTARASVGEAEVNAGGNTQVQAQSSDVVDSVTAARAESAEEGEAVRLYRGDGTATPFAGATGEEIGGRNDFVRDVVFADLDGDGDQDLVTAAFGDFNRRFLNDGTGAFDAGAQIGTDLLLWVKSWELPRDVDSQIVNALVPDLTMALGGGDVDGDGDIDLVAGNLGQRSRVYLNDGAGEFFPGIDVGSAYEAGDLTFDVALADMDGDGDLDLVTANFGQANRLYFNDGSGLFETRIDLSPAADYTTAIAVADLQGDGRPDVIAANVGLDLVALVEEGRVRVQDVADDAVVSIVDLIDRTGVTLIDLVEAELITRVDFLTDALVDIADLVDAGLARLEGLIDAGLLALEDFADAALQAADVTASGLIDDAALAVSGLVDASGLVFLRPLVDSGLTTLRDLVHEGLVTADDLVTDGLELGRLWLAGAVDDLAALVREGLLDATDLVREALGVPALLRSGLADLTELVEQELLGAVDLALDDATRTPLELAQQYSGGAPAQVYLNVDGLTWTATALSTDRNPSLDVVAGDVDGDGDADVVVGNAGFANRLYLNAGDGTFGAGEDLPGPLGIAEAVVLADMDGDGDRDLLVGLFGDENRLLLNDGAGGFGAAVAIGGDENFTTSLAVADVDGDGDADAVSGNARPSFGFSGSIGVVTLVQATEALVGDGATLTVQGSIGITAESETHASLVAGAAASAETGSIGLSAASFNVLGRDVLARIGDATVTARGLQGLPATQRGVLVSAQTTDDVLAFAAGEAAADDLAAAGSAVFNTMASRTDAMIANGAAVTAGEAGGSVGRDVILVAGHDLVSQSTAGSFGDADRVGLGAALDVQWMTKSAQAHVEAGANVVAQGDVVLRSVSDDVWSSTVGGVAGGGDLAIAGSAVLLAPRVSTRAGIDGNVVAEGSVVLQAFSDATITTQAGASTFGGTLGVGASIAALLKTDLTEAWIGATADVRARAQAPLVTTFDGRLDGAGIPGQRQVAGVSLAAVSHESIAQDAAGASENARIGGAGSVVFTVTDEITTARIDEGARVNQFLPGDVPGSLLGVTVAAGDATDLIGRAGVTVASGIVGIGFGVDVAAIGKTTTASLAGTVDAGRNVEVAAFSREDLASLGAALDLALAASVGGAGTLYAIQPTTRAVIGERARVRAGGSVAVTAEDRTEVDLIAGTTSAALGVSVGASAGVAKLEKVTEAVIAAQADVVAGGTGDLLLVNDAGFIVGFAADGDAEDEVSTPDAIGVVSDVLGFVFDNPLQTTIFGYEIGVPDITPVSAPADDRSLTDERTASPTQRGVRGVAVTAVSTDDVETLAVGFGASLGESPELSGSLLITTNRTTAGIGAGAQVVAESAGDPPEEVLVAAGSDTRHLGIAGVAGVSLGGAVGLSTAIALVDNLTEAFVGFGAVVRASGDVTVEARAAEDVLLIAGSAAAAAGVTLLPPLPFGFAIAGSLPVISLDLRTHAFLDVEANVQAGGDLLVRAVDDSDLDLFAGTAAVGLNGGVGASVAMTLVDKDTQAWIGANAVAAADGRTDGFQALNGDAAGGVVLAHGVGVQALSSEDVLTVAVTGGVASLALPASLAVTVLDSDTAALIGAGASINAPSASSSDDQSVQVGASNRSAIFGVPVNLTLGAGVVAAGIDVGIVRNDVTARIGEGAQVRARRDVEVHAVSSQTADSFVGALGATTGLGLVASVSLYTLRAPLEYEVLGTNLVDFLNIDDVNTIQTSVDAIVAGVIDPLGAGLGGMLAKYEEQLGPVAGRLGAALSTEAPQGAVGEAVAADTMGSGVSALVEGATVQAGGNVRVTAIETTDAVLDTSFTFNFALGSSALVALYNDRALLSTGSNAQAAIRGAGATRATVVAGDAVLVHGEVSNVQTVAGSTATSSATNEAQAAIESADVTATGNVEVIAASASELYYSAVLPSMSGLQTKSVDNKIDNVTDAHVSTGAVVTVGGSVLVAASDDSTIEVVSNATTLIDDGLFGMVAVGLAMVTNDIDNTVEAYVAGGTVTAQGGEVRVTAAATTDLTAVAVGIAQTQDRAAGGSVVLNDVGNTVSARVTGGAVVTAATDVVVSATDTGTILAITGGAAIANDLAVGAAFSTNAIHGTVRAFVTGAEVEALAGRVELVASATPVIRALAIGASGADGVAAGGSVTVNEIENDIEAYADLGASLSGSALVRLSASDGALIESLAGGAAASLGFIGIGGAVASNDVRSRTRAYAEAATLVSSSGGVQITAHSSPIIRSLSAGAAGAADFGFAGSVSINTIATTVEAQATDGAQLQGATVVDVTATDASSIAALAGSGAGAATLSVSGSFARNSIGNVVAARVDASEVNAPAANVIALTTSGIVAISGAGSGAASYSGAGAITDNEIATTLTAEVTGTGAVIVAPNVLVQARDQSDIEAVAGVGTGSGTGAIAGAVADNGLGGRVEARIGTGAQVDAGVAVTVLATNEAAIRVFAGGGAGAGTGAAGIAIGTNTIAVQTTAGIDAAAVTTAALVVQAGSVAGILSATAVGAGAGTVAGDASTSENDIDNVTDAYVTGAAAALAGGTVRVQAIDDSAITALSGAGAGAGTAAIAAAFGTNRIGGEVRARIDGASVSGSLVDVLAQSDADIGTVVISGSGAGTASFGGSVAGNEITRQAEARVTQAAQVTLTGQLTVAASDTSQIESVAGNGNGAGTVAGGMAVGENTSNAQVRARIDGATVTAPAVTVTATTQGGIDALTAVGGGAGTVAGDAAISTNVMRNLTEARVGGGAVVTTTGALTIGAAETRTVRALTGAAAGAGVVALAAGWSTNDLGGTVSAGIDGGAQIDAGSVAVEAQLASILTVIGVGGAGSGAVSATAGMALNDIHALVDAHVGGGAFVESSGSVRVSALDASTISSFSGNGAGAAYVGIGAAAAYNEIANTVRALVDDATVTVAAGSLDVSSRSSATIFGIAAGGGGAIVGIGGSVAVNYIENTVLAYLKSADVDAAHNVVLLAEWDGVVDSNAGAIGVGAVGIGGSVAMNTLRNTTRAFVDDSTVAARGDGGTTAVRRWNADSGLETTEAVRGLAVVSTATERLTVRTATVAGATAFALAGTVSINTVAGVTEAFIAHSDVNSESDFGGAVIVRAHRDADVDVFAGALVSATVGIGGAVDRTTIGGIARAFISDRDEDGVDPDVGASHVYATRVEVSSLTRENIAPVAAGLAGGLAAVMGAVSITAIDGDNDAFISASDVFSRGELVVLADDDARIDAGIGVVATAFVGAAGSVSVNLITNTTRAQVIGGQINAVGALRVEADSDESITTTVGTGAVGTGGLAGGVTVNTIETTTEANVVAGGRASHLNQDARFQAGGAFGPGSGQSVTIEADDRAAITSTSGTLGAGLVGIGATIDVGAIRNRVVAIVGTQSRIHATGNVTIEALAQQDIDSTTVAVAGGLLGISGAISVQSLGAPIDATGASRFQNNLRSQVNNDLVTNDTGNFLSTGEGTAQRARGDVQAQGNVRVDAALNTAASFPTRITAAFVADATGPAGRVEIVAGGDLRISATHRYDVDVTTGQLTVGVVGLGAGVGVVSIDSVTQAYAGNFALLEAGGALTVRAVDESLGGSTATVDAYAGNVGITGISAGGAVGNIDLDLAVDARVGNGAILLDASTITIEASQRSRLDANAFGFSANTAALGASVANASVSGGVSAAVGNNVTIGAAADAAGSLAVRATADAVARSEADSGAGGVVAGQVNLADAEVVPVVQALVGSGGDLRLDDDLTVHAGVTGDADADADGVVIAAGALGRSRTEADLAPTLTASLLGTATVGGTVTIEALHEPSNDVSATSDASGGGVISGTGADATARSRGTVTSRVGAGAVVTAGEGVIVRAASADDARAVSGGFSLGGLAIGGSAATAATGAPVQASVDTGASIEGSGLVIEAVSAQLARAEADATQGGVVSGNATDAQADVTPTVSAFVGNGARVDVTGSVLIRTDVTTDADAPASGTSVGLLSASDSEAHVTVSPTLATFVGTGADIVAGGNVTIVSRHGEPANVSNGNFTAADPAQDTLVLPGHGLVDGAVVGYDSQGNPSIGGLVDERDYRVLVVDADHLRLGATFDATMVDAARDRIVFTSSHKLETGDAVIYDAGGGAAIGGLVQGQRYFVRRIDDFSIMLATSLAQAQSAGSAFSGTQVDGAADTITIGAHGFADGQVVTYTAPAASVFAPTQVDAATSTIAFAGHGLATGDEVMYETASPAIGGLVSGTRYFVIATGPDSLRLAASAADASGGVAITLAPRPPPPPAAIRCGVFPMRPSVASSAARPTTCAASTRTRSSSPPPRAARRSIFRRAGSRASTASARPVSISPSVRAPRPCVSISPVRRSANTVLPVPAARSR